MEKNMVNMICNKYHENLSTGLVVAHRDHIFMMQSAFFNSEVFLNFSQTYLTWFFLIFKFSKLKQKNIHVIFFHQNLLGLHSREISAEPKGFLYYATFLSPIQTLSFRFNPSNSLNWVHVKYGVFINWKWWRLERAIFQ